MGEGEAWYLDLNLRHTVRNRGDETRIHLVIDCVVNDWLRAVIDQAMQSETPIGMVGQ